MHCRETHISQRRLQAVPKENDTVMLGSAPLSLHGADLLRFPTAESSGLLLLSSGRPPSSAWQVSLHQLRMSCTRARSKARGSAAPFLTSFSSMQPLRGADSPPSTSASPRYTCMKQSTATQNTGITEIGSIQDGIVEFSAVRL